MRKLVVVMQAKKRLFFQPLDEDEPPMPFMLKGDLRVLIGKCTVRPGYHPIEHNDDNFRFFVPLDMTKAVFGDEK